MEEATFQQVRENFHRVEEFGWFSSPNSWTKNFEVWPNGKYKELGYRQAAVLFLISYHRGDLHVLITRRSHLVSTHKGIWYVGLERNSKSFSLGIL